MSCQHVDFLLGNISEGVHRKYKFSEMVLLVKDTSRSVT